MADTIKDVVIRIAIQAGDTSGFTSAMDSVKRDIQSVADQNRAAMQGAMSGIQYPQTASTIAQQQTNSLIPQQRPMFAPTGGAQGVRERASEGVGIAMQTAEHHGLLDGMSDEDLAKMEAQLQKKAEAFVREQDQEVAAAERAYDKEAAAAIASYSKIMKEKKSQQDSAVQMAIDADKQREEAHRKYLSARAEEQKKADGVVAAKWKEHLADKSQREKSAAELSQRKQGVMDNDVANAVNVTNRNKKKEQEESAKKIAEANNNAAASANALQYGLVALTAIVAATAKVMSETRDITHRYLQGIIGDTQREGIRQQRTATAGFNRDIRLADNSVDIESGFRTRIQQRSRKETEFQLRSMEQDRTDITPEKKQEIRDRAERDQSHREEMERLRDQRIPLDQKRKTLTGALDNLKQQPKRVEERFQANIGAIKGGRKFLQEHPDIDIAGVKAWHNETLNKNDNFAVQAKKALVDAEKEILEIKNQEIAASQQLLNVEKGITENATQQHKVTKAQQQAAYQDARKSDLMRENSAVGFGSSSFGDQARLKMLDAKISRIKAQQAAGEKEEQLLPHEMQLSLSHGIGTAVTRQQAIQRHDENPLQNFDESIEENRRKHEKLAEVNQQTAEPESKAEKDISEASTRTEELSDRLYNAIKSAFNVEALVDKLEARLGDLKSEVDDTINNRGKISQSFKGAG